MDHKKMKKRGKIRKKRRKQEDNMKRNSINCQIV